MSEHKRNRSGKGYYIALILCAAAIWITGYVVYRNGQPEQEVSLEETYEDILVGTLATEDIPAIATQAPTQPTSAPQSPTVPAKQPLKPVSPVSGEAITGYSMEALSYNQTTRDWRVHNGIDLAADAGTEVVSSADGEIYTVMEDDALGYTVVIRHDDGYATQYASLSSDVCVSAGDKVTAGQTIGYASDSALVETTLGSHVHFSVTCHDEPMDPMDFLALGE